MLVACCLGFTTRLANSCALPPTLRVTALPRFVSSNSRSSSSSSCACVFLALLIAHRLFVSHWPAANWAHVIAAPRENDCVAPALRAGLAQHQPPCFPLADN